MNSSSTAAVSKSQEESQERTGLFCSRLCLAIPLGTWFGIRTRLSVFYILVWGFLGWFAGSFSGWGRAVFFMTLFGPVLISTILIHEFGHAITTNRLGGHSKDILIWPLGGVALLDHNGGPKTDFWIMVAGPLTHLPQAVFWLLQAPLARMVAQCPGSTLGPERCYGGYWDVFWYRIVFVAILFNLVLFAVNLLIPMYPLDGGRALLDACLALGMTPRRAAIFSVSLSIPLAITIAVLVVVYLQDWLSFGMSLLMLVPNLAMIYLLVKDVLHLHPSFRNLNLSEESMDRPFIDPGVHAISDAEVPPVQDAQNQD